MEHVCTLTDFLRHTHHLQWLITLAHLPFSNPSYVRNHALPCAPTPRSWTTALRRATAVARRLELSDNECNKVYKARPEPPEKDDPLFCWELGLYAGNTEASILQPPPETDNREERIKRLPKWKSWRRPGNKVPAFVRPEDRRASRWFLIERGYWKRGSHRSTREGGSGIQFGFQRRPKFVPVLQSLEEVNEKEKDKIEQMKWRFSVGIGGMAVIYAEEREVVMPRPRNLCRLPISAFEMDSVESTPWSWMGEGLRWMGVEMGGDRRLIGRGLKEKEMTLNDTATIQALDGSVTKLWMNYQQINASVVKST